MQSGKKRHEIAIKYGIPNVNMLSGWVHSCLSPLEIQNKCVNLPPVNDSQRLEMAQEDSQTTSDCLSRIEILEKQIQKLETDLKKAKDKNLALNTLIDIAEERGIKIRKKSGAKQ
ncbi:hypothetical protein CIK98_08145 [Prevotella sp. P2-180]|nr:hypothetical protein CIK98_08145 [Prevotella sp. P2-180]